MSNPFADLPTNVFVQRIEQESPPVTVVTESVSFDSNFVPNSNVDTVDTIQAAEILGITVNNLRQIVFKKQLIAVGKKGRRLTFNHADVIALRNRRSK